MGDDGEKPPGRVLRLPHVPRSRLAPEAQEALLVGLAERQEALSKNVDRLIMETATRGDVSEVLREVRLGRRIFEQFLQTYMQDRAEAASRQEAIMGMLGDIIARLPAAG